MYNPIIKPDIKTVQALKNQLKTTGLLIFSNLTEANQRKLNSFKVQSYVQPVFLSIKYFY